MTGRFVHFVSRFVFLFCVSALPHGFSGKLILEEEKTLAIVKPDGFVANCTGTIKKIILEAGFCIREEKVIQIDEDGAKIFYAEHSAKSFFPSLIKFMSSGPVLIMVLEKANAVSDWRALIGPTDSLKAKITHPESIRAMCGLDSERNCVHGSDSQESAAREISLLFGEWFQGGGAARKHDEL